MAMAGNRSSEKTRLLVVGRELPNRAVRSGQWHVQTLSAAPLLVAVAR